jgi:hypothetical protein
MNALSLNQVLDIAIVLFAVYASLACVSSWIHEWIAARLALRGWDLFRGISALAGGDDIAAAIFNHPLILNTSPKPQLTVAENPAVNGFGRFVNVARSGPPSYLDARNFSLAFWQVVQTATKAPNSQPATNPPAQQTSELAQLIAIANPAAAIAAAKAAVAGMQSSPAQKSLLALITASGDDYEKLLRTTDSWFDAQMDRVSGWYKRRTKTVLFFIALLLVSISGVDSIAVVKVLSATDPNSLATLATSAGLTINSGAASFDITQFASPRPDFWNNWASRSHSLRWPGLALTWLAVWLGGPFWFEALLSLINVRATGRVPERTDQPPQ